MPMRAFTCWECGVTKQHFQSLLDESLPKCPCGGKSFRDYSAERTDRRHTGVYEKPIEMFSVACSSPEEIQELKQKCPDIEVAMDGPLMGVPIARSREQKLRVLKAVGFEER